RLLGGLGGFLGLLRGLGGFLRLLRGLGGFLRLLGGLGGFLGLLRGLRGFLRGRGFLSLWSFGRRLGLFGLRGFGLLWLRSALRLRSRSRGGGIHGVQRLGLRLWLHSWLGRRLVDFQLLRRIHGQRLNGSGLAWLDDRRVLGADGFLQRGFAFCLF